MAVDSHCHLADEVFQADLDDVVSRATAAGVSSALCILSADEPAEVARATDVRVVWPAVHFAAAIHPHRSGAYRGRADEAARITGDAVTTTNAVAVGEIGLDYHYDFSPKAAQQEVFAAQARLAQARSLPVVIHMREATDDTLAILRDCGGVRGVLHCFSGTMDEARRALDLGLYISLSGIVTFPKAGSLRDVAAFVPEDRILVETDSPYLSPVPHRGTRNEPARVMDTLAAAAAARGVTAEAMDAIVTRNFMRFIGAA